MRWREILWAVCLGGLPLSPLLLGPLSGHKIDLWHSHAWWAYCWMAVLVCHQLASEISRAVKNLPLAWWTGWVAGWWLISFFLSIVTKGGYDVAVMMGMLHLATGLVFYHLAVQVPSEEWERILPWVARVGVVLAAYGILQHLGCDQFFRTLIGEVAHGDQFPKNRRVVGTIGNPSHFAAYLSCVWPLVLAQRGKHWWVGRGLLLGALALSRSWGGILATILVTAWWYRRHWKPLVIAGSLAVGFLLYQAVQDMSFFSLSGRWERWTMILAMFQNTAITGAGPGAMLLVSQQITDPAHPLWHWRHAHNEYLQLLVEQGVIGLTLVGWMLTDCAKRFWAIRRDPTANVLVAVLLAFCLNALYNFPAHLWVMSSLGLVAYAGIYRVTSERTAVWQT